MQRRTAHIFSPDAKCASFGNENFFDKETQIYLGITLSSEKKIELFLVETYQKLDNYSNEDRCGVKAYLHKKAGG